MPDKTISKRKWAPKNKGGCNTCKSRHVRCDEKQPRCTPCQKSLRKCDYSANPDPDHLKIVLWQPNSLILRNMFQHPSHASDELRAVDFFCTKVAVNLSGFFDSTFWTRDILQLAQREDPIRHAIVALASLSETMLKTNPPSSKFIPGGFTIRQHAKAISNLRQNMQGNNEASMEVVLTTCALLICFEMFQNHHDSALKQMSSGLYVFYNWHSKFRQENCKNSPNSTKHSNELVIELQRVFERLMLQTIMFVDTRPSEWRFITPAFTPALPSIPSLFRSIDEARDCLNGCMCSLYHTILTSQFRGLEENDFHELPTGPASQLGLSPLDDWLVSFDAFMTVQKGSLSTREQKAIALLRIQQIIATILAVAVPFSQEILFDSFEQSFSQIIAYASSFLGPGPDRINADPNMLPIPSFDMGILPPLYFVASRCRHPLIRRHALHLLRQGPRQEGVWHRDALASIAERLMIMEEMSCNGARSSVDIPAEARLSVVNATIDSVQRRVTLHCCRQQFVGEGKTDVIHEIVYY